MFDPFGDFDTALAHLAEAQVLGYGDFLAVHRILFEDYYPWAGQDRSVTAPNSAVNKGKALFSHPGSARLAVEYGLQLGQDPATMAQRPGEVMGHFAYGHPFLDGNGRTMLLAHMELCHRAGFSIAWGRTSKTDYLAALSQEIDTPAARTLDAYLLQFKAPQMARGTWGSEIQSMRGLDGLDDDNQIEGDLSDPAIVAKYKQHEAQRGYASRKVEP